MKELIKKIASAKKEIGAISKDSTNPFYKSKYFDINAILHHVEPIFDQYGLLILQPIQDNVLHTQIWDIETGEMTSSNMVLPEYKSPQDLGSAITYYRRYSLQSLLSLQAEDDDGEGAKKPIPPKKEHKAIKPTKEQFEKALNSTDASKIEMMIDRAQLTKDQKDQLQKRIDQIIISQVDGK